MQGGYVRNLQVNGGNVRLDNVNLTGTFTDNSPNTIRNGCHNLGTAIADRPQGAWKAHKGSGDQTGIASGAWTKVTFGSEVFDTLDIYNAGASSVTPRVGIYEFRATLSITGGVVDSGLYGAAIYKNGTRIAEAIINASGTDQISPSVSCFDYTDGSGTYEVYVFGNGTGTKTVSGNVAATWFEGRYVGALA